MVVPSFANSSAFSFLQMPVWAATISGPGCWWFLDD